MSLNVDAELLKKYDMQGVHYISYPTAPAFSDAFSIDDYLRHIEDSNGLLLPKPLSLYIHIPLCHSRCYFCACNKEGTQKKERIRRYLNYLYHEISLISPHLAQDRLVTQIHFGGDSLGHLNTEQFREILDVIARHFHLSYPEDLGVSIDIDPSYADAKQTKTLAELGFNHIRIGVQDDNKVQAAIKRRQYQEQVNTVIMAAREGGVQSIAVDLVSGFHLQTRESFADTLTQVVDSGADQIVIDHFAYPPQHIRSQRLIDNNDLSGRETRQAIICNTQQFLSEKGYVYIGLGHFALPDNPLTKALQNQQLNYSFQGYVTHADCDQVGLGVSAISQIGDAFIQNSSKPDMYYASLNHALLPIQCGISLDVDDLVRTHIIQRILCQHPIDYAEISMSYPIDFNHYFASELQALAGFARDGLIIPEANGFTISSQGKFFLRNIAMVFGRHAQEKQL